MRLWAQLPDDACCDKKYISPLALQKEVRFVKGMKFPTVSNVGNCRLGTNRTQHSEQVYISDDHALINVIHWMQEVG